MTTRAVNNHSWWWVIGATGILWLIAAGVAAAGERLSVRPAVQTTFSQTGIGPGDAPVRSAVLTTTDREQVKFRPARWWYGGYYGYAPYYAYYPAPYYYSAPYYAYYTPPTYYSATPNYYPYYAPGPVFYRYPRRAFYGAYYW